MTHIKLENHLPGVTSLLEFRKDTAEPLRELTQILMRGTSTLTEAERELIATAVSAKNECTYCTTSHAAAADVYFEKEGMSKEVISNLEKASISDKMKALINIALKVQESGKSVFPADIDKAKEKGASDKEIHDTVMIAALFCFYNRYVDGLGTYAPKDPDYYSELAARLKQNGYYRPEKGYEDLEKKKFE